MHFPDETIPAELKPGARATKNPTVLYLIRHGEPHARHLNCYYGDLDVELSERGHEQSRRLAERLAHLPLDAIYSSNLERAALLAELLAASRDLPVRRLASFREQHLGCMQGIEREVLQRDHAELYSNYLADRVFYKVPEAETFEDLHKRVVPEVLELVAAFAGRRVALVCHAGPIRVVMAHVLGMSLENIFRIKVDHCGVFALEFPPDGEPRVMLMNG